MTAVPDWLVPPFEGWHFSDLLALPPDGTRHIELIDGALIPVSPQSKFHVRVTRNLQAELDRQAPGKYRADSEMTLRVDDDNGPEPDVLVVTDAAYADEERVTWYDGRDVVLAVEVVTPSTQVRDRERMPQIYAKAGISHLWRIENEDGSPVLYVYKLDAATGEYALTGIFHERVDLPVPFPVEFDLRELSR